MIGHRHVIAVVQPVLLALLQLFLAALAIEGEVVDPARQAETGRDGTPPFIGVELYALDAAQIPERHRLAIADIVEHMLGPATAGRLALHAGYQRELHHLRIEVMRHFEILGRYCEMMKSHFAFLSLGRFLVRVGRYALPPAIQTNSDRVNMQQAAIAYHLTNRTYPIETATFPNQSEAIGSTATKPIAVSDKHC